MPQANAHFAIKNWDENTSDGKPYNEVKGAKLTHAQVAYTYDGEMVGESTIQYLMSYNADGSGSFVALEKFVGSVGGKSGSFIFQHIGTFEPVKATLTVLPESGTGELVNLRGEATIELAGHQESYPITLAYEMA